MGGTQPGLAESFPQGAFPSPFIGKGLGEGGRVLFQGGEVHVPSGLPLPRAKTPEQNVLTLF